MKKLVGVLVLGVLICVGATFIPTKEIEYDYLRLHIRANSNSEIDQKVKYKIKDELVEFLSPYLFNVESKEMAVNVIKTYSSVLKNKCESLLNSSGFNYSVNIKISNEYFPTRTYSNTTLE